MGFKRIRDVDQNTVKLRNGKTYRFVDVPGSQGNDVCGDCAAIFYSDECNALPCSPFQRWDKKNGYFTEDK